MIHFRENSGETSDAIIDVLTEAMNTYEISNKTIAYCADNAPVNFGGITRKGKNNVFYKLKQKEADENIIGKICKLF